MTCSGVNNQLKYNGNMYDVIKIIQLDNIQQGGYFNQYFDII